MSARETPTTAEARGRWRASAEPIVRTWRFAYRQEGARVLWALGAVSTGVYIATAAWLSKQVVDALIGGGAGRLSTDASTGMPPALGFAALYALATLLHAYVGSYYTVRLLTLRDRVINAADRQLMSTVAGADDMASFDRPASRDRIRRASVGARGLPAAMSSSVDAAQHLATILGVCLVLARYHPILVPLVVLPPIPLFYTQLRVSGHTFAALANKSSVYRRMRYFIDLALGTVAAKEVRIYRTGHYFLEKYEAAADEVFTESRTRRRGASGALLAYGALAGAGVGGAYLYVVWLAARQAITIGDVVMYTSTVFYGAAAIRGLIQAASSLTTSSLEVKGFFDYLDGDPAETSIALAAPQAAVTPMPGRRAAEWTLRNVTFAYEGQPQPAVENVSLRIEPGEKIAIVGVNGAGKTTLMKLMLRLLTPDEGAIEFRGHLLKSWDVSAFRRSCGVVFQDFARFKIALRENVAIGVPGGPPAADEARVLRAAREAGVDEIAARLPLGYDTRLGKEFRGGTELSDGQWNRVALARALAREGTVLWLDEPTASLDPKAEQALFELLLACARSTTAIIISHRLAITPVVDRIIVLDGGRIIEEGSHAALMARDGVYAGMYRTQAGMYWPDAAGVSATQ